MVLLSFIADVNEEVAKIDVIPDSPRKKQLSKAPEVNILDFEGTEIANDVLSVKGFENFKANDYRLEYLAATSENTFFIVTPRDIIVARPTDIDDHIQWLVDRKKYEEALIIAEGDTNSSQKIKNIVAVGQKWMHDLIKQQRFTEAAANCPKILRNDIELWESWFFIFAEAKQIPVLLEYIPTHPKLSLLVYEMVLAFYLYHDPKVLLSLIVLWNPELYTSDNVIDAIFDAFKHDDKNIVLMECLYLLFVIINLDTNIKKTLSKFSISD